jgi:hypothetical protein
MPGRNSKWRYPNSPEDDASRNAHLAYAIQGGFFWLPCTRCGKMFGGHEVHYDPMPGDNKLTCCPDPLTGK